MFHFGTVTIIHLQLFKKTQPIDKTILQGKNAESMRFLGQASSLASFCEKGSLGKILVTLDCYIWGGGLTELNICSSAVHRQISI